MQRLYEIHKVLTYPRTDSRYLTEDIVPTLPERLRAVSRGEFAPCGRNSEGQAFHRQGLRQQCQGVGLPRHHPHRAGGGFGPLLPGGETDLFDGGQTVSGRFDPPYEYRRTRAELLAEGERFYAAGRTVLQQGWRKVQDSRDEDEADEQAVPLFHRGDVYTGGLVQCKALKTAPPARYTEATLLSAMETPPRTSTTSR